MLFRGGTVSVVVAISVRNVQRFVDNKKFAKDFEVQNCNRHSRLSGGDNHLLFPSFQTQVFKPHIESNVCVRACSFYANLITLPFSFGPVDVIRTTDPGAQGMFNSGSGVEINPDQLRNTQTNSVNPATMSSRSGQRSQRTPSSPYPNAFVKITEQPAPKALRFRYECEGRSAGSIPGTNSTSDNKTYPGIQVVNYRGRAVVVVSCVTKDQPYR